MAESTQVMKVDSEGRGQDPEVGAGVPLGLCQGQGRQGSQVNCLCNGLNIFSVKKEHLNVKYFAFLHIY